MNTYNKIIEKAKNLSKRVTQGGQVSITELENTSLLLQLSQKILEAKLKEDMRALGITETDCSYQ